MKKPPPGHLAGKKGAKAAPAKKKAAHKKKPAAKKPPAGRKSGAPIGGGGSGAAVGAAAAAAKKSILAGPALAAHHAHLAHLAHLARLGIRPKVPPKAARRQLALGEGVACCAAEALAASLRLAGRRVGDCDVLALYRRTASDPDTGATVLATLQAAYEYGLAGYRPAGTWPVPLGPTGPRNPGPDYTPLILGLELPGSHAVLAAPDGSWWSWGEQYDPGEWPDAVIEEAWAVTWE